MTETDIDACFAGPGPDELFHAFLAQGKLMLQRDLQTGEVMFYPRAVSPFSHSPRTQWVEMSGQGEVYSTTVVRNRPEQGGPVNVALITLAEGPRLMSRVEGIAPDKVTIGMKVKAKIIEHEGKPLLVFMPAGGEA